MILSSVRGLWTTRREITNGSLDMKSVRFTVDFVPAGGLPILHPL